MDVAANGSDAAMSAHDGAAGAPAATDASDAARQSQKERRVYVGNLSYEVKGENLKEFMRDGACLYRW